MRTDTVNFIEKNKALTKNPRLSIEIASDVNNTDLTYINSHPDTASPDGATVLDARVLTVSGISQTLNPIRANSSLGNISIDIQNTGNAFTTFVKSKLDDSEGLRHKRVKVRLGYKDLAWSDYAIFQTQIVERRSIKDGIYKLICKDIQRSTKQNIFEPGKTTLSATISETDTTITLADTTILTTLVHGASYSDAPSATVGYMKIGDEVIRFALADIVSSTQVDNCVRGILNTRPARHEVDATANSDRRPEVLEYIYFELPIVKVIYGVLTGILYDSADTFPWNLGISTAFVDSAQFIAIGDDIWDSTDDTVGRIGFFSGRSKIEAKKFIETECLRMIGCFMPVLNDGQLGIKRLANVLFDANYVRVLDETNIVSYSDMISDDKQVHNYFDIDWNFDASKGATTRSKEVFDTVSRGIYQDADKLEISLPALHGSRHAESELTRVMNFLRDRYTGPPKLLTLSCLFTQNDLEIGDVVRVQLDQIIDDTTDAALDRSFEIQNKRVDLDKGVVTFQLFGSSEKPTPIATTAASVALLDAWYTTDYPAGNKLDAALSTTVIGDVLHLDTNGTLAGQATLPGASNVGVYWHDTDIQLDADKVIGITENVIIVVQGFVTINGKFDGKGQGTAASAEGTAAGIGNTLSGGGVTITEGALSHFNNNYVCESGYSKNGAEHSVPDYALTYDGTSDFTGLVGLPTDLRGSSGAAGKAATINHAVLYGGGSTVVSGGAGGAGGAGLIIICRGIAMGASSEIDLSGNDGSEGVNVDSSGQLLLKFKSGTGGGGAAGGFLAIMDGTNATETDVDTHFTANNGDSPVFANLLESISSHTDKRHIDVRYQSYYRGFPSYASSSSNHRIVFIESDETPTEDVLTTTSKATVTSVVKTDDLPSTPAESLTSITVSMTANSDSTFSHTNVYWKVQGDPDTAYEFGGIAPDGGEKVLVAAMDGTIYDIKTVPVSIFEEESTDFDVNSVTVANKSGGATLASGNFVMAGQTAYDTGIGFYLGNDSGTPKFSIGNSGGNKFTWDGSTLSVTGTITATLGFIGGWTIAATSIHDSANRIFLDHGNARIQVQNVAGTSYTRMDANGITGVDSVLGTVFTLPTDGSAPTFSSGNISLTNFAISTSGILETATTVGDGTANSAGIRINDVGIKGYPANSSTPNFELLTADGSISALLGDIGGFDITSTLLRSGSNIGMDSSNKYFYINSTTYGNQGIMLDYNGGTPRMYCGDGSNKFFEFDGTDVKFGKDSKLLGADSFNNDNLYVHSFCDEETDTYSTVASGTGAFVARTGNSFVMRSASATGGYAAISKPIIRSFSAFDWSKSRRWKGRIQYIAPDANTEMYAGMGAAYNGATTHIQFVGFKVVGSSMYGVCRDGTATTTSSSAFSGISVSHGDEYTLLVVHSSSSVEFFVDGVSKDTITTNIPTGTLLSTWPHIVMGVSTENISSPSASTEIRIGEYKFEQDP